MQLLLYSYITVLWIHVMNVVLLAQGGGEMTFFSTVPAVLLHHSAMDTWTDCSIVSTE